MFDELAVCAHESPTFVCFIVNCCRFPVVFRFHVVIIRGIESAGTRVGCVRVVGAREMFQQVRTSDIESPCFKFVWDDKVSFRVIQETEPDEFVLVDEVSAHLVPLGFEMEAVVEGEYPMLMYWSQVS